MWLQNGELIWRINEDKNSIIIMEMGNGKRIDAKLCIWKIDNE